MKIRSRRLPISVNIGLVAVTLLAPFFVLSATETSGWVVPLYLIWLCAALAMAENILSWRIEPVALPDDAFPIDDSVILCDWEELAPKHFTWVEDGELWVSRASCSGVELQFHMFGSGAARRPSRDVVELFGQAAAHILRPGVLQRFLEEAARDMRAEWADEVRGLSPLAIMFVVDEHGEIVAGELTFRSVPDDLRLWRCELERGVWLKGPLAFDD